ncbi:Chromosome partition protein Smc [Novipirellula galeiformis]|uniref:Chromosome partition protein Smc n=1 Tax=Novipirellula galeiformis TaxID=2528004 RepID=A0A5C6CDY7_9BACT|nr:hypothetical protein [Novipirellula galeiformis]TWU21019.1 Chromosome partition protein Smc [Novipirellula galeiformis]
MHRKPRKRTDPSAIRSDACHQDAAGRGDAIVLGAENLHPQSEPPPQPVQPQPNPVDNDQVNWESAEYVEDSDSVGGTGSVGETGSVVETGLPSQTILAAIDDNTLLLRQLIADFTDFQKTATTAPRVETTSLLADIELLKHDSNRSETHDTAMIESLRDEITDLEYELSELKRQNSDLAAKVANANVRKSTNDASSDFTEALPWEERKKLILRQMEEDTFDAETFLAQTVQSRLNDEPDQVDPIAFVNQVTSEIDRLQQQNERFENEINELNHLLEHRPPSAEGGLAIGAAAIAQMVDADELIQEERQRLQELQDHWEEKFRQAEIEASLERAKLSRERQEVAQKSADLEEQLDRIRRDAVQTQHTEGHSRKWLAKLGLADD